VLQQPPSPQPSDQNKLILCMKWGSKYGADYVNRLQRMVARHLSPPFQMVCLSDDPLGLDPAIRVLPLPELGCAEPTNTRGKWRKVALWGAQLDGLGGPALFVDLDSVIVGDLDPYFSHGDPSAVILERNWARPLSGLGQTSVFRFPIGSHPEILERFRRDPQAIADRFGYEQHFISHCLGQQLQFWPRGWTRHFRLHCLGPMPLRYLRPARLPSGSRIITFPGGPNPSDVKDGKWKPDSPPYGGRKAHLRRLLASGNLEELKRFAMPVPWIDQHWG
jgi:hypothetical protein